jgi:hypothetical protein
VTFDVRIELLQILACLLRPRITQAILVKEEVDAQILFLHGLRVENGVLSNTCPAKSI